MSAVKRAHMVTRGYLEAWANQRGLIYVWDGQKEVHGVRPLRDATVVSHAYRTEHLKHDLEAHFGRIESQGIPSIRLLAEGGIPNREGRAAIIQFMDMHLERGRYADQAEVRMPVVFGAPEGVRPAEMGLGDRLTLARDVDTEALRLESLNLERWRWRVHDVNDGLVTGDGAVLLWRENTSSGISAITFPLSPKKILILGTGIDGLSIPINQFIVGNCRRWLVEEVNSTFIH